MADLLRPCPFCGGDGGITTEYNPGRAYASCCACGARGPAFLFRFIGDVDEEAIEDATKYWNRRDDNGE